MPTRARWVYRAGGASVCVWVCVVYSCVHLYLKVRSGGVLISVARRAPKKKCVRDARATLSALRVTFDG